MDVIGMISLIVAIIGLLIALVDYIHKYKSLIQIKNVKISLYPVNKPIIPRLDSSDLISIYYCFLSYFDKGTITFDVLNKSTRRIEIYGFYFEILFFRFLRKSILIPIIGEFERDFKKIDVFLSDWKGAIGVDSYFLPEQSLSSVVGHFNNLVSSGHLWSCGYNKEASLWSNALVYLLNHDMDEWDFKVRIVCKDTYGRKYYSKVSKIKVNMRLVKQNFLYQKKHNSEILKK